MARINLKMKVDDQGRLEVIDPGYDTLDLIHSINPDFEIKSAPLPCFTTPRFQKVKRIGCGLSSEELDKSSDKALWDLHDQLSKRLLIGGKSRVENEASLLDLKIALAYRILKSCRLCGRQCVVDRTTGAKGVCGLGMEATVFEYFIHIAEEAPVNPSLNLVLGGCGLQCRFCQQDHLLDPSSISGDKLEASFWKKIKRKGARTLSFIGGNPDESLYAILRFLANAPARWGLPIVWNCNGYASSHALKLLHGIVDVYIPDFKFGHSSCGDKLARASNYLEYARTAISIMMEQMVPVIVRILVLPGHYHCCHKPILDFLAEQSAQANLFVSIRDQYFPDGSMNKSMFGKMNRRVCKEDVIPVMRYAKDVHLNIIV